MKLSCIVALALFHSSNGQWHLRAKASTKEADDDGILGSQWSFRTIDDGRNLAEAYGRLYSDASCLGVSCGDGPICIELRDPGNPGDDEKLTIGDCSGPGWRLDSDGLFHSEADDNQCMQAGRDGSQDGTKIRMFGCDSNNELQKFVYERQQLIKPVVDESLCAVWHGNTPNFGTDDVLLKKCNHVADRAAWSGDLPIEDDTTTPPVPSSGCANYEATVLARGHQADNSYDPDAILANNDVDASFMTQVKSTDELFDGFNTLGYIKCNQASYQKFPSDPSMFGEDDGEEWGITCTAILMNQDKSDGSMSQLVAIGLPGGLFDRLDGSPLAKLEMPVVGGSGPFQGAVGTIGVRVVDLDSNDDGCTPGSCDELTWKIRLCGV